MFQFGTPYMIFGVHHEPCNSLQSHLGQFAVSTFYLNFKTWDFVITNETPMFRRSVIPGPTIGAGLPGLIFAGGGLLVWWRNKRRAQAVV